MRKPFCRFCKTPLTQTFCNLGMSPLANSYLKKEQLEKDEPFFPLHAYVCPSCFLVQLEEFESPQNIFRDYAYFSSYFPSWLAHCKNYTETMIARFKLNRSHQVIEVASNDGYLLKYFQENDIPILGIEPAENVAKTAIENGIPTEVKFFTQETARELYHKGIQADLLLGNNVLAHVPNLNDFVAGLKIVLKPTGIITMEFPHLLQLIERNQFDTIYHEHFSYLSFLTVEKIFAHHKLTLFDVELLPTHGGSLRIYAKHAQNDTIPIEESVRELKAKEIAKKLDCMETYKRFDEKVQAAKQDFLKFLHEGKRENKKIVGYGAPAKGNTLLNFCRVDKNLITYTVDSSPHKQGKYLPGTHIPIYSPEAIKETKPDYVVILPWNLREEIMQQLSYIRDWGGKFVIPIPKTEVIS